ncbi:MAG TPA: ankyrin repeat domain-containing protein [Acidimicrobiia bacterium]|nr:ankyrin repeat domain-containing protein [Acidimicrobiia bacterium]
MTEVLPEFPDLEQLRRQAKDLLSVARSGEAGPGDGLAGLTGRLDLNTAQLALARRYGYGSWPRLKLEVERKSAIHHGDIEALRRMLVRNPWLAVDPVSSCFDNDSALGYLGVARFHGLTDHDRAGEIAKVLLAAGGVADGPDGAGEPPLVTAASYGEAEMVQALIAAGADLEAAGFAVPGGTALAHAVAFGNIEVVNLLAGAGAIVHDMVEAAGVGSLDGYDLSGLSVESRARAAKAAAVCERLEVLDLLIGSGVPVDADPDTGNADGSMTLLHEAAYSGKPRAVERLLALGADPNRQDTEHQSTPLGWCRHRHAEIAGFGAHLTAGHLHVERILEPITNTD